MPVVVEELTQKVLDACHGAKLWRERKERTADSGAEQPADDETDVVADVVGATRNGEEEDIKDMQHASKASICANDDEIDSSSAPPGNRFRAAE